jgi:HEPN domain-containing protein
MTVVDINAFEHSFKTLLKELYYECTSFTEFSNKAHYLSISYTQSAYIAGNCDITTYQKWDHILYMNKFVVETYKT